MIGLISFLAIPILATCASSNQLDPSGIGTAWDLGYPNDSGHESSLRFFKQPKLVTINDPIPHLIPKPKRNQLNYENMTQLGSNWKYPAGIFKFQPNLIDALNRRFSDWREIGGTMSVDGGIADFGLRPGGYTITIGPGRLSVLGEDEEGLRTAVERVAQLAIRRDGRLMLPVGTLVDEPQRDFRGVHLFVGPEAVPFHNKLWTRVLRPLGFNRVVLQCERTTWDAIPGTQTKDSMSKSELQRLVNQYRTLTVEPIPLIQSFGHMEWFFANGKNLDLAINPEIPYAVDPRKPESIAKLNNIWTEADTIFKSTALHFGLDEVDMRGFPKDPDLVTELWKTQIGALSATAKRLGKPMMLWGDKCLAPGEAIDATHGDDEQQAIARRSVLPKNAYITDWHYRAEPEAEPFRKSLNVWFKSGQKPIASMWFQPDNIRGFTLAAKGLGTLQTTWAGYVSNESNMLRELKQFTAMVLAADYAWSDRGEKPSELPYNAEEVFRSMYFGEPQPVKPRRIGTLNLGSDSSHKNRGNNAPGIYGDDRLTIKVEHQNISGIVFHVAAKPSGEFGECIADLEITASNGSTHRRPIRYGIELLRGSREASAFRQIRIALTPGTKQVSLAPRVKSSDFVVNSVAAEFKSTR